LEPMTPNQRILEYKARVEMWQTRCASLLRDLAAAVTDKEKSKIARNWFQSMTEHHAAQSALTLLEREVRAGGGQAD
jgi:hypothetical protein